jgi:glycosyltransferase involved in cell wall biosynthesis
MELSVVIPTRDRREILRETLERLAEQRDDAAFEVVVVDDGSSDGTQDAVRALTRDAPVPAVLIEQPSRGPAAGRNRAVAVARAPVCLFLNDDSRPRPGLIARHAAFHRRRPEPEAALLGGIVLPDEPAPTPFMRWHEALHFGQEGIRDRDDAGGARFYTANVSAKVELLRRAGGFDEAFPAAAHEDVDLGLRLERCGLRLAYDPDALVEHCHPIDLAGAIARLRRAGRSLATFTERHPGWPAPRRPGARHRVKAAGLVALAAARVRAPAVQRETWRFLCHEATREGYWEARDRGVRHDAPPAGLRIGGRLAQLAARDPDARLPAT